jgi:formylglycine-generating enzyme required for sulfatase activity
MASSEKRRVLRGGSWLICPTSASAACRFGNFADLRGRSVGFRVVQDGGFTWSRGLRGGSWLGLPASARAAYRFGLNPDSRVSSVGFRVLREGRDE